MPVILEPRATGPEIVDRIRPTPGQRTILIIIGAYILAILILWHLPVLKIILYPFKLLTVALHEFSHAAAGCCTCAKIESIQIDPDEGGATRMRGGISCCTLPAGYLGSSLIGALLIFCGFDDTNKIALKVAAVVLGVILLILLFWAKNWLLRGLTVFFIGVIVALWFVENGAGLRYFVLFVGVMSCLYSLWDIMDDLIFRKVNESDASKFAKECRCCPSQIWGCIWLIISFVFLGVGVLAGLAVFRPDNGQTTTPAK
ncbi:peptidase M50B-like-domain-containing protein [Glomus cerebriforme]|uniref:Peptidase M50B-like-domain-containing protein n=1 Tax=Glomus cerebriforme TaxID=658196 RepID=A0A397TNL3_9GLOM|nr:peptidase M50B-like-domain-containing protein [Glomus cerebriforme]